MLILTTNDIMALFDIKSAGTLTKWKGLGAGQAATGRNRWDARKFLEWWLSNIYAEVLILGDESLATARRQYWSARAEGEELRVGRLRGDLMPTAEVREAAAQSHGEMSSALDNFSARVAAQVVGIGDRDEVSRVVELEVFALKAISARRIEYSAAAVAAVLAEWGGMTTKQARTETVHKQRGKPNWFQWNVARGCFIDTRDNTMVPEENQADYLKKYPCSHNFREKKNAEKN